MNNKIEDDAVSATPVDVVPAPQAQTSTIPLPAVGGSYSRDPVTGELKQLVAPPKTAQRKQSTQE